MDGEGLKYAELENGRKIEGKIFISGHPSIYNVGYARDGQD